MSIKTGGRQAWESNRMGAHKAASCMYIPRASEATSYACFVYAFLTAVVLVFRIGGHGHKRAITVYPAFMFAYPAL